MSLPAKPQKITPTEAISPVVSSQCGVDIAALVKEDAQAETRSESFIVKRILERHYAKRLKARAQGELRRAA